MMPPRMNLPPAAMPWGRFMEDQAMDAERVLDQIRGDANSVGNQFAARADNMSAQIRGVQVATIVQRQGLDFTRIVPAGGPLAPYVNVVATPITVTPPSSDAASCVVIVNYQINATVGNAPNIPIMKLNGVQFSDANMTSDRPDGTRTHGVYAMNGSIPLRPGQPVTIEYGAKVPPFSTSTLNFHSIRLWIAFYGGVN